MAKVLLKEETHWKIVDYLRDGCITHEQYDRVCKATNIKQAIKSLRFFKPFTQPDIAKIWMHIINNVWKGVDTDEKKRTVFSENEAIFFKELLNNGGQLTRRYALSKIFSTCYLNDRTAARLEEMGIIDILKLPNYEVIYSLNLNFYQEVMR